MSSPDLTRLDTHFAFGRNWQSYASIVDERRIERAAHGLRRLMPEPFLVGKSFLDIGCGSGLHACAATRLGIARLFATDIDPDSVAAARGVIGRFGAAIEHRIEPLSVFDMTPASHGTFDVVYSWGVLHHTGDLRAALARSAALVSAGGHLVVAIYGSTVLDRFWVREKRWYSGASPRAQAVTRVLFDLARGAPALRDGAGGTARDLDRGMDLWHDLHDWLGGYPYETMSPHEVDDALQSAGLRARAVHAHPRSIGVFGAGCNEYVYVKD